MDALTINFTPVLQITDEQFFQLCQINELIRFERNADGTLLLMPLVGGLTSNRNANLTAQLGVWNRDESLGIAFGSSVGFILPNGAVRSPDLSWLRRDKWDYLTQKQKEEFPPVCPDFLVELRSDTDCLRRLQNKMQEYGDNGTRLGWLIDLEIRQVEIYRFGRDVEVLQSPASLSGEDILPGFVLNFEDIW
ncbi:Uma2 family endonuclease [Nostoc sphaeroides]|uniref:Uma2 family endonuclease n=1 Tax=Nostoc sphaeroides CCNUC1 TaxID=2653204 RepID=A0A5P8VXE5_9NOSO|nr:Uma2 family endonuclease [Nostoc sphaeroides]MCC5629064.1 Uma2 family endonuclease [Nostoc sphaeroides CHAB 2801]QFS44569.1 Uma2 family endonuclease [Nostoc sphaeroides CCNUC1]